MLPKFEARDALRCIIGDTRKRMHHVPLAFRVLQVFLSVGFLLREDIVKTQWNTLSGRKRWKARTYDFLLLAYEHLFVLRKPMSAMDSERYPESSKWW